MLLQRMNFVRYISLLLILFKYTAMANHTFCLTIIIYYYRYLLYCIIAIGVGVNSAALCYLFIKRQDSCGTLNLKIFKQNYIVIIFIKYKCMMC